MQDSYTTFVNEAMTNADGDKTKNKHRKTDVANVNYFEAVSASKLINMPQNTRDDYVVMKNGIKDEMSIFFNETSFTALTQIYKANSMKKRLLWTFLVIGMFAWLAVQCYWLLDKYYSYPIEVKLDFKASTVLEFPSVTICNLNPIREENVNQDPYRPLQKFVKPEMYDILFQETLDRWTFNDDCHPGKFQCNNGRCLSKVAVCDGNMNCKDGEDERNCTDYTCPLYQWKCTSLPKCIPLYKRCDGQVGDCNETSEEDELNYNTCPNNLFRCSCGLCIPYTYVCDGTRDCGEDEINCTTTSTLGYNGDDVRDMRSTTAVPTSSTSQTVVTPAGPPTTSKRTSDTSTSQRTNTEPARRKRDAEFSHLTKETEDNNRQSERDIRMYDTVADIPEEEGDSVLEHLRSLWNDMKGSITKDKFIKELHTSYINYQKSEIFNRKTVNEAGNVQSEEKNEAHRRVKRHSRPPPDYPKMTSNMTIDWNAVLWNSTFNKWKMLMNATMSSRFYEERDDEYEATMTYMYITAQMDPDLVEKSGHQKENFIASCDYDGYQCSPANFTYFHSHKFGNCYTFNSKFANTSKLETRFSGPERGLRLELFLDQNNYVANLATEAGVRVLVHKKGSIPFPEDEGISVMPGRSTSIGIRQEIFTRLPPPHGVCANTGQTTDYYAANKGTDYSKLACLKSCFQDLHLKFCNCCVPFYYVVNITKVCNITDRNIEQCMANLHHNQAWSFEMCDKLCPQPCHEIKYKLSVSSAIWPSDKYEPFLQLQLSQTNSMYRQIEDSSHEFTKLQIYFQDLIYKHVEQQKGYESMNLISDLGGQLGLWLGLSAITLGELCSCFFGIGRSLSFRCWGSKTAPRQSNLTPIRHIEPATLEEMYEDMCPEAAKYITPKYHYVSAKITA